MIKNIIDYWNNQPCNIKHSNLPIGSIEYFEEVKNKRYKSEPHILEFANFSQWQEKEVLEIGCGIGTDGVEFARHNAKYTGIDISSTSIELAKKRFNCYNLPADLITLDAVNLNFINKFDLVYSFGVLHHYPDIELIIEKIYNSLKPGGEFRFMVYSKHSWKQAMILENLDQYEAQANCPYVKTYSKEEISNLLKRFTIKEITQDHCFMYNVGKYKQGIYELEPWFEAMPESVRNAVKKQLGWHLLVKATK